MDKDKRSVYIRLSVISILGTLWKLYPHMIIDNILPSGESYMVRHSLWLVENPITELWRIGYVPYLEHYLVFIIQKITGADILRICFLINPILAGISVFAFYYFASTFLDERQSLVACTLFACSEAVFYRTSHFGSSEALGILFMFIFFGLYARKKYLLSGVSLIITFLSHMLPFAFSIIVFVSLLFLDKKTRLVSIVFMLAGIIFIFSPFCPYDVQIGKTISRFMTDFSFLNIFIYTPTEILTHIPYYGGFISLFILSLLGYGKWNKELKVMVLASFVCMGLSMLAYNSYTMSPTRFVIYMTIPLILGFSGGKNKKSLIGLVMVLMISAPLIGGMDAILWTSDAITNEEIEALEYFADKGYFDVPFKEYFKTWFFDTTIKQYVEIYWDVTYPNPLFIEDPKYIFISERMLQHSLFIVRTEGGVQLQRHHVLRGPLTDSPIKEAMCGPIIEVLSGDPHWIKIYDLEGVIVYEKVPGG